MDPRKSEDRELQETLRLIAAMVLLGLFAFIALFVVLVEREWDVALILGLGGAILGAMAPLLGVQLALSRRKDGDD